MAEEDATRLIGFAALNASSKEEVTLYRVKEGNADPTIPTQSKELYSSAVRILNDLLQNQDLTLTDEEKSAIEVI